MMHGGNIQKALCLLTLLVATSVLGESQKIVISFEEAEGFPAAGSDFSSKAAPPHAVAGWSADSPEGARWFIDDGPSGAGFPDAPPAITGARIAGLSHEGVGIYVGTLSLKNEAKLGLDSFYWAWRGSGDSRSGGNAYLEVEYFDLNGKSVGSDRFQGGLNPDWSPKFGGARIHLKEQDGS